MPVAKIPLAAAAALSVIAGAAAAGEYIIPSIASSTDSGYRAAAVVNLGDIYNNISNAQNTANNANNTANYAVTVGNNANKTANYAVSVGTNAQNTANDARWRAEQLAAGGLRGTFATGYVSYGVAGTNVTYTGYCVWGMGAGRPGVAISGWPCPDGSGFYQTSETHPQGAGDSSSGGGGAGG